MICLAAVGLLYFDKEIKIFVKTGIGDLKIAVNIQEAMVKQWANLYLWDKSHILCFNVVKRILAKARWED